LGGTFNSAILPQGYRTGPGHVAGIALDPTSFVCPSRRWGRGEPGELVKAESSREDPRATGGLVSDSGEEKRKRKKKKKEGRRRERKKERGEDEVIFFH